MQAKNVFQKSIIALSLATLSLLFAMQTNARVKIGTNPTTIGSNSNLEVEAINGSKTVITKDLGKVGIGTNTSASQLYVIATADPLKLEGLQNGATTDEHLVVDANGVVRKKIVTATENIKKQYATALKVPVHAKGGTNIADFTNHSNTDFELNDWYVLSKTSVNAQTNEPPRMTVVYKFQGLAFDLTNLYSFLMPNNDQGFPDIYCANNVKLENVAGKIQLSVAITRVENLTANWGRDFFL
jgi:hypothetical protein